MNIFLITGDRLLPKRISIQYAVNEIQEKSKEKFEIIDLDSDKNLFEDNTNHTNPNFIERLNSQAKLWRLINKKIQKGETNNIIIICSCFFETKAGFEISIPLTEYVKFCEIVENNNYSFSVVCLTDDAFANSDNLTKNLTRNLYSKQLEFTYSQYLTTFFQNKEKYKAYFISLHQPPQNLQNIFTGNSKNVYLCYPINYFRRKPDCPLRNNLEKLKSYIISTGIIVYDPMCIDEEVLISENLGVRKNSKLEIYKKDRWSLMHEKIYITEPELDNHPDGFIVVDELPNKSVSKLAKSQTPQRDFFWIKNSSCLICWRPFIESKHHAGVLSEIQYAIHNNIPVIAFSPIEDLEEHPSPFASMVNLIPDEDEFYYQIRKFINPNKYDMMKEEKPPKYCDHTSVGVVIYNDKNEILLIERGTFPFGMAVPAGHVDEHASYEEAAIAEAKEEVGLDIFDLELIAEGRRNNPCRRVNGTWHYWKIFKAKAKGEVALSEREAKRAEWCSQERLIELGMVKEKNKTIEPVWLDWFSELNILPKIHIKNDT